MMRTATRGNGRAGRGPGALASLGIAARLAAQFTAIMGTASQNGWTASLRAPQVGLPPGSDRLSDPYGQCSWIRSGGAVGWNLSHLGILALGSPYSLVAGPPLQLTQSQVTLSNGGLSATLTNFVTVHPTGRITLAAPPGADDHLSVTINRATGFVHGYFVNPADPARTIGLSGVVFEDQTLGAGFFLNGSQSGDFLLAEPGCTHCQPGWP